VTIAECKDLAERVMDDLFSKRSGLAECNVSGWRWEAVRDKIAGTILAEFMKDIPPKE
jgi:hypothetical protein